MSDTTKQVEHEVKGAADKVAGTVTGSDELREKGDEHLEEAHEMEESREVEKVGISKGSDGTSTMSSGS
jgi:hypothetical protein